MFQVKVGRAILAVMLVIAAHGCANQPPDQPPVESEAEIFMALQTVLDDQVTAWNSGDIQTFMTGYWKSDSLRFASGGEIRRGWQTTLERYIATYPDRAAMGQLQFVDLEMRRLSPQWAMVFGRYRLKREAPLDDLTGLFTLMFEKREERWVIVSDHTSAG